MSPHTTDERQRGGRCVRRIVRLNPESMKPYRVKTKYDIVVYSDSEAGAIMESNMRICRRGEDPVSEVVTEEPGAPEGVEQRLIQLSDPLPSVPEDDYDPVYSWVPFMRSADDSMAGGFWVWRKRLFGFVGRNTGVMLSPEWGEVLEPNAKADPRHD